MKRIFISYKRVDKKRVFEIKNEIEAWTGEECWIDIDGIESDAQFANVIIHAIKDCELFLFMYSQAHSQITDYEHDWTIREINFAETKGKRIVFLNIDGSELTDWFGFMFGTKQRVDMLNDDAAEHLYSDIAKWLKIDSRHVQNVVETEKEKQKQGEDRTKPVEKCKELLEVAGKVALDVLFPKERIVYKGAKNVLDKLKKKE